MLGRLSSLRFKSGLRFLFLFDVRLILHRRGLSCYQVQRPCFTCSVDRRIQQIRGCLGLSKVANRSRVLRLPHLGDHCPLSNQELSVASCGIQAVRLIVCGVLGLRRDSFVALCVLLLVHSRIWSDSDFTRLFDDLLNGL